MENEASSLVNWSLLISHVVMLGVGGLLVHLYHKRGLKAKLKELEGRVRKEIGR